MLDVELEEVVDVKLHHSQRLSFGESIILHQPLKNHI